MENLDIFEVACKYFFKRLVNLRKFYQTKLEH